MKYIPITCRRITGLFFSVDNADEKACLGHHWNMSHRYPFFNFQGENSRISMYAHKFLLTPPVGMTVDHIDGDVLNNQRNNLELVTLDENKRRNRGPSLVPGVRFSATIGMWCVFTRKSGNYRLTYTFPSAAEAIKAKMDHITHAPRCQPNSVENQSQAG